MGSLKSSLLAIALASLVGAAAVVGCSANGGGAITESDPTVPDPIPEQGTGKLPPTNGGGNNTIPDAGKDASKKDSGPAQEAGVDAGPPAPVEGAACPTLGVTGLKACGACGFAGTLCLDDGTGKGKWGVYGTCDNQLVDGCTPGTIAECGNCGKKTCTSACVFPSVCIGEPVGGCKAGSQEFSSASCPTAGTYRTKNCSATCAWGLPSATCDTPMTANKMTLSATVGGVVSADWTLAGDTKRPSDCPGLVSAGSTQAPYVPVEIVNTTAKIAELTIYHSKSATGKPDLDTVMWTYAGKSLPINDATLGACVNGIEDNCLGPAADLVGNPCGNVSNNYYFAGIEKVSVPAGGSVIVFSSLFSKFTAMGDGTLKLNVKTTKLQ